MKPSKTLSWDIGEVAAALKIDSGSVHEYFTDGRRVAFLIERRARLRGRRRGHGSADLVRIAGDLVGAFRAEDIA